MLSTSWTIQLLQDSPRLHITANDQGAYIIRSADDVPLYVHLDARYVSMSDPLHTNQSTYWRCFLRHHRSGQLVTEIRRHMDTQSAIGMTVFQGGEQGFKTGLEYVSAGYGPTRYVLKWHGGLVMFFDETQKAPNTDPKDKGSLRCSDSSGTTFAWLHRERLREDDGHIAERPSATIWFENEGIQPDLVDVIISGLLAITDVQFPIKILE